MEKFKFEYIEGRYFHILLKTTVLTYQQLIHLVIKMILKSVVWHGTEIL
jgi:hypothetical protein